MILRSVAWDGLPPAPGDVVRLGRDTFAVVTAVAQGPGMGQWRIDAAPARVIDWRPASWVA